MNSFGNGKQKAVTFSFDDGNIDDIRLVEIFNKYKLKCTFNLSTAKLWSGDSWNYKGIKEVHRINYVGNENLYDGHEVACHGYTHPHLSELHGDDLRNQIILDKKILTALYGYEIKGMAYPFGSYNDEVVNELKIDGIKYCRTVISTHSFDLPDNLLTLNPTCKFDEENAFALAERFLNMSAQNAQMLYIWGHSYELVTEEDWSRFERLCSILSGKSDIWYATNIEIAEDISNSSYATGEEL